MFGRRNFKPVHGLNPSHSKEELPDSGVAMQRAQSDAWCSDCQPAAVSRCPRKESCDGSCSSYDSDAKEERSYCGHDPMNPKPVAPTVWNLPAPGTLASRVSLGARNGARRQVYKGRVADEGAAAAKSAGPSSPNACPGGAGVALAHTWPSPKINSLFSDWRCVAVATGSVAGASALNGSARNHLTTALYCLGPRANEIRSPSRFLLAIPKSPVPGLRLSQDNLFNVVPLVTTRPDLGGVGCVKFWGYSDELRADVFILVPRRAGREILAAWVPASEALAPTSLATSLSAAPRTLVTVPIGINRPEAFGDIAAMGADLYVSAEVRVDDSDQPQYRTEIARYKHSSPVPLRDLSSGGMTGRFTTVGPLVRLPLPTSGAANEVIAVLDFDRELTLVCAMVDTLVYRFTPDLSLVDQRDYFDYVSASEVGLTGPAEFPFRYVNPIDRVRSFAAQGGVAVVVMQTAPVLDRLDARSNAPLARQHSVYVLDLASECPLRAVVNPLNYHSCVVPGMLPAETARPCLPWSACAGRQPIVPATSFQACSEDFFVAMPPYTSAALTKTSDNTWMLAMGAPCLDGRCDAQSELALDWPILGVWTVQDALETRAEVLMPAARTVPTFDSPVRVVESRVENYQNGQLCVYLRAEIRGDIRADRFEWLYNPDPFHEWGTVEQGGSGQVRLVQDGSRDATLCLRSSGVYRVAVIAQYRGSFRGPGAVAMIRATVDGRFSEATVVHQSWNL